MKKILVPTDFSDLSMEAFNTAKEMADEMDAEIHLLHGSFLLDNFKTKHSKEEFDKKQISLEKKHIKELEKLSRKQGNKDLKIKTHYCNTHFISEILSYSKNNAIDLIVMATDDYKNKDEYLEESNTLKIIRLAQCPVLVIKSEDHKWKAIEIVFASDFNKEALPAFENLVTFAKPFNLKINLIRIGTQDKLYKDLEKVVAPFAAICPKESLGIIWEHHDKSIQEGINQVSKKFGYCTIAIGSHHREYDNDFYKDTLSETIIFESEVPVLAIPISIEEIA